MVKDFFRDFAYMCSASNTKSRGTYIFLAVVMITVLLCSIVGIGFFVYGCIIGKVKALVLVLSIFGIVAVVGSSIALALDKGSY